MNYIWAVLLGVLLIGGSTIFILPPEQEPPKLEDTWWGPGEESRKTKDESVRPFEVVFSDEMIADLKDRLKRSRELPAPLEDVGWTYGVNGRYMKTVRDYWLNKYDFKARERILNKYPQFVTNIQGLDIHFVHVRANVPKDHKLQVIPLLILHGWPGSVVEFQKIIPLLVTPRPNRKFVFEVIAPSLPGFGYSDAATKAGLGAVEMAHVMKNLMLRLGFQLFLVQGGDWGSVIVSNMAAMYPQHLLGLHSNMCWALRPWTWLKIAAYSAVPWLLPEDESQRIYPLLSKTVQVALEETGYFHLQATKPDTLGISMSDSPIGLAAYILEKFSTCTKYENKYQEDGNLLEKFNMDELLDNIMMYWVPNAATTSFRIYAETFNRHSLNYKIDNVPIKVPTACAQFPNEIIYQPELFLRDRFVNLIRVTKMPRGGHFAAMEEPLVLSDDIWATMQAITGIFDAMEQERQKKRMSM